MKWLNNYETGTVGGKELVNKMYEVGTLNDGRKLSYAFGISIGTHKGWKQIGHGGGDAGFRTYACRFPEKGLGIVVFSNHGATNPTGLTNQVADVFITEVKDESRPEEKAVLTDSVLIKKLQGRYYSERGDIAEMFWRDGKFFRKNAFSGATSEMKLRVADDNQFQLDGGGLLILDEKDKFSDSITGFKLKNTNNILFFKRQPKAAQKITAEFTGKYYGEETEAFYHVVEKDGALTLAHRKHNDVPLKYIAPDQFTTPHWWMNHIRFIRDKKGKISAFEVNSGRILHLKYDRVK